MKYGYYPGCSMKMSANAYDNSMMAIAPILDMEFEALEDWNCCGATEYASINGLASHALVARNLAIAEKQLHGEDLVAGCSACFINLTKTEHYLRETPELNEKVSTALEAGGFSYNPGSINSRHLLEVIATDVGYEKVYEKVTRPLFGLKVAPYYGCLIVRPGYLKKFDNPEYPISMDKLIKTCGAEVADFGMKTACCGGHMTQIKESTSMELLRRILQNAEDSGADLIITTCPMCQLNLDAYQTAVNDYFGTEFHIPVLFFTQLMGLAFGLEARDLGFGQEFTDALPVLERISTDPPVEPKKSRPSKDALPKPSLKEEL